MCSQLIRVILEAHQVTRSARSQKFEPLENEAQNDASIAITVIIMIMIMMGRRLTEGAAGCVFVTATES